MMLTNSQFKVLIFSITIYILFLWPLNLNAQIIITEVMYNPDGTDSGREWVEIYNSGSESVDITDYKLLENGTNHRLSAHNPSDVDNLIVNAGGYAIIADNPTKFLIDYSNKGLIIDSAFSLKNTGEEISIVDSLDQVIDSFNYLPELGADGTGNSLQLNGSDWIPAEPTPFIVNKTEPADETDSGGESNGSGSSGSSSSGSSSNSSGDSTHSSISELSNYKPKIDLKVSAGRERYISVNTEIDFELIHNQDSNSGISAIWSMGDGIRLKGKNIDHTYTSSGVFNIVLNAKNKEENAVARTKVYVSDPSIELTYQNWGKAVDVLLKNSSNKEVNIGEFDLVFQKDDENIERYEIATDTILSPKSTITLVSDRTEFPYSSGTIKLYYPNRKKMTEIDVIKDNNQLSISEILKYVDSERLDDFKDILDTYELYRE